VLLMATNREFIEQCETVASAAGLKIVGITATSAALGRATSRLASNRDGGWVLNWGATGAEVVVQHGENVTDLRHLAVPDADKPESVSLLAGEIRRMMASVPRNGTPNTLAVWRGPSKNGNPGSVLEQRLSMPVTMPELDTLVTGTSAEINGYAPAVAVALSALEPAGLPVDFLNSRLAPPEDTTARNKKILWGTVIALIVAVIATWYFDVAVREWKLQDIRAQNLKLKQQVDAMTLDKKRLLAAETWIPKSPLFVACWADVAKMFPEFGRNNIWVTNLANGRESGQWTLKGKAISASEPSTVVQNMLNNPGRFSNPRLAWSEEPSTHLINYTIQFGYYRAE
jgi:hypothetical protein